MKVRCTNCMKEFDENKIIFDGDIDTEFYQNENPIGMSYFKSDIGMALLCPCRLKKTVLQRIKM